MNNFRRALLGGSIEYIFRAQTSVNVRYNSSSINVDIKSTTADGSNIDYSVVSYDGTVVKGVATAPYRVTIRYSENPTYDERSGNVVLKQNDSNKTITIKVSQSAKPLDLGYGGILLDGASGSNGNIPIDINVSLSNVPSWANVTYSSGKISVTASSANSSSTARLGTVVVSYKSQSAYLKIIQLPSDYHSRNYVSIGGSYWSIKNVGASSVADYGNYYMYGKGSRMYTYGDSMYKGTENPLASTADTATQVMGSGWRMPTRSELQTLTGSSYYWVSYNGVNGCVFEDGGNVLFIPAAGYYGLRLYNEGSFGYIWSSTSGDSSHSSHLYFYSAGKNITNLGSRDMGQSVRGVLAV